MKKLLVLLLFITTLFSSESKELSKLSQNIATPFYNMYVDHVLEIVEHYVKENPSVEAVEVYDYMLEKEAFVVYKDNNRIKKEVERSFPKTLKLSKIFLENEIVKNSIAIGRVTVYFKEELNALIPLTKEDKTYIKKQKIIKVGMVNNFHPFSYVKDGIHQGFSADVLERVSKISGLQFEIVTGKWSHILNAFKTKELDVIMDISYKKEREKFTLFTKPYYEIPTFIFGKKNDKNYIDNNSLRGKRVAVTKDIFYIDMLKELGVDVIELDSSIEKAKAVIKGEADYFTSSFTTGQQAIVANSLTGLKPIEELFFIKKEDLRFGVNPQEKELFSIITKSFNNISEKEMLEISNKWILEDESIYKKDEEPTLKLSLEEDHYLELKEKIKVCVNPERMPFDRVEGDKHLGITKEFLDLAKKKLGVNFEVIPTKTWAHSLALGRKKACDIVVPISPSSFNQKYFNFTTSFLEPSLVVATKEDRASLLDMATLSNKKVGVVDGYGIEALLSKKYKSVKIVEVDSVEDGLNGVLNGELYGFADTLSTIGYYTKDNLYDNIKIATTFEEKLPYSFAVRSDDEVLILIMQKLVNSFTEEEKQNIVNKWLSLKVEEFNYTLIIQILVVVSIVLIIVYLRDRELRKFNKRLQERVDEELKKSQDKDKLIFQQNKLISMNEMIENIAHQWRQPLAQINSAVLLIDDELYKNGLESKNITEKLDEVEAMTAYMSATIENFRNFYKQSNQETLFSLEESIKKTLAIVEASFNYFYIEIESEFEEHIMIRGYEEEFSQVILVILNNAKEILKEKREKNRRVTIKTSTVNEKAFIEICDNAGGVDEEIIEKIFDPYFTTKHQAQGKGLGLYVSKIIIENKMHGKLNVINSNEGACFTIELNKGEENGS